MSVGDVNYPHPFLLYLGTTFLFWCVEMHFPLTQTIPPTPRLTSLRFTSFSFLSMATWKGGCAPYRSNLWMLQCPFPWDRRKTNAACYYDPKAS